MPANKKIITIEDKDVVLTEQTAKVYLRHLNTRNILTTIMSFLILGNILIIIGYIYYSVEIKNLENKVSETLVTGYCNNKNICDGKSFYYDKSTGERICM
jgi:hypothetical protein